MPKRTKIDNSVSKIFRGNMRYFDLEPEDTFTHTAKRNGISFIGDIFSGIHDKEILISPADVNKYYPEEYFGYKLKHILDKQKDKNYRTSFVQTIDSNIDIVLEIHKGGLSGVGFDSGYEMRLGIRYFNLMIKYYSFKDSLYHGKDYNYDITGVFDEDFLKAINFNKFIEDSKYSWWLPDYNVFGNAEQANWYEIFKSCMDGTTFNYTGSFLSPLGHGNNQYPKDLFVRLGVEKLIISARHCHHFDFDIPTNFAIEFDIKKDNNTNNSYDKTSIKDRIKQIIASCPNIRPYLPVEYRNSADRITFLQAEQEIANKETILNFTYKNLYGFVHTDEYQYRAFKEFYDKCENVDLDVAGLIISIPQKEFYKCIKKEDKIKYRKNLEAATNYFGSNKIGYTDWWKKSFDICPPRN
jgi:hypothetical protein